MAIATFQCDNEDFAIALGYIIKDNPPHRRVRVGVNERFVHLAFVDKCELVYYYCMELVTGCTGRAAFLGIDELALKPGDYYNLATLDTISLNRQKRSYETIKDFNKLRSDFLVAIKQSLYSYDEVLTVCQRCVLGEDKFNSVKYCTDTIHYLSVLTNLVASNVVSALDCQMCYSDGTFNTMVRCMAHYCYLRLAKFNR